MLSPVGKVVDKRPQMANKQSAGSDLDGKEFLGGLTVDYEVPACLRRTREAYPFWRRGPAPGSTVNGPWSGAAIFSYLYHLPGFPSSSPRPGWSWQVMLASPQIDFRQNRNHPIRIIALIGFRPQQSHSDLNRPENTSGFVRSGTCSQYDPAICPAHNLIEIGPTPLSQKLFRCQAINCPVRVRYICSIARQRNSV